MPDILDVPLRLREIRPILIEGEPGIRFILEKSMFTREKNVGLIFINGVKMVQTERKYIAEVDVPEEKVLKFLDDQGVKKK